MQISENMMARQGNVSLQDVLDRIFMNEDSEGETDDSGDGWQPDSDRIAKEECEIVGECGNYTAMLAGSRCSGVR